MSKPFAAKLADFPDFPAIEGPADLVRPVLFLPNALNVLSANGIFGVRAIMPKTGVLHDLAVYVGVQSGNVCAAVLDTTVTTRNRLYTSGSIACPAVGWQIIGDPALQVNVGDHLDFVFGADNATASFARCITAANAAAGPLPAGFLVSPLGGSSLLAWSKSGAYPPAATVVESTIAGTQQVTSIIARIT